MTSMFTPNSYQRGETAPVTIPEWVYTWEPPESALLHYQRWTTSGSSTTSTTSVIQKTATVSVVAGHLYRHSLTFHPYSTVAGDRIGAAININGSTDDIVKRGNMYIPASSNAISFLMAGHWEAPTTATVQFNFVIWRASGTGTIHLYSSADSYPSEWAIQDMGVPPQ